MVEAVLSAEGLRRSYGSRLVLDVERIAVLPGEVLAVVGPNGAGKSTLFRLLLLLDRPDSGIIRLNGATVTAHDGASRGRLAGVFQRPILFSGTVRDNVGFGLRARRIRGAARRDRVLEALGWLDLVAYADVQVSTLSGGEAQRVALARALVTEPDVLLLDEPTSSLDVSMRHRFRRDLERVARQRARAIVLVTHDAAEAFGLADRVVVLEDGRVVQAAAPEEVMMRPGSRFIAELTGAELLVQGRVVGVEQNLVQVGAGSGIRLWATSAEAAVAVGADVVIAYRPEDITLAAPAAAGETSAMNRVEGRIAGLLRAGALTRVRIEADGLSVTAHVTSRSLESLGLVAGDAVSAHIKATALHVWQRDTRHRGPEDTG